jgi:hypothetical protein
MAPNLSSPTVTRDILLVPEGLCGSAQFNSTATTGIATVMSGASQAGVRVGSS